MTVTPDEDDLAKTMSNKLFLESQRCKSIDEFLDLSYSFNFDGYTIEPFQRRDEIQKLLHILDINKPKTVLEIGTANGGTLFLFCRIVATDATIISIDLPNGPFGGKFYPRWKTPVYKSFGQENQDVHLLRNDSHDIETLNQVKSILGKQQVDFLFIDGDHTYEGVKRDFEMYSPLVAEGGMIAFHDINTGTPDNVGDSPRFWKEIKSHYPHIEIIDFKLDNGYGIGIIFVEPLQKNLKNYTKIFQTLLEMKKKELEESQNYPLSIINYLYSDREDLRKAFPEVAKGQYNRILDWASDVVSGKAIDSSLDMLIPFSHWYQSQTDEIKKADSLSEQVTLLNKTIIEKEIVIKQMQNSLDKTNSRLEERDNYIRNVEGQFKEVKREKEILKNEMSTIQASFIYNSFRFVASLIDKFFPNNSRRGELKRIGIESLRVIRQEGIKSYLKHINAKVKRGEFKVIGSIPQEVTLLPEQSVYSLWINSQKLNDAKIEILKNEITQFHYKPKISIITPVYNTPIDILRETITSVINQVYENWEFCICDDASTNYQIRDLIIDFANKDKRIKYIFSSKNQGISGASNEALRLATGEFAGLLDHDDVLTRDALFEVVKLLNTHPETDYVYSDEDKMDEKGIRMEPFFKPDWSPDLFYSMHYATHFSVIRKKIIDELGGFRSEFNGSQDYDLVARVTEITDKVYHIPKILYSWRKIAGSTAGSTEAKPYAYTAAKKLLREYLNRRKIKGDVLDGLFTGSYRIRYQITGDPLVSIIIPNKNNQKILEDCIDSIKNKTTYQNYEIIIVDNDSTDEKTKNYLKTLPFKIINYKENFNFSKINNLGVKNSNGEYIVFLNNDTTIITPDWLESLLEHAQRQEIGIAGAKLLYPDNTVQHAGTIVGFNGDAYNYGRFPATDHGYFGLANVIRNCSAVTAACMMIKKSLFERLGGFDENLAHSWQDVDLCLRVLDSGKRIVYTPYSQLYHMGGATRGELDLTPEEKYARSLFIKKHQEFIKKGDPHYNPNLLLHEPPYVLKIDPSIFRDPMQLLVGIYLERSDLQREMPEVKNGEFSRLIEWAAKNGIKNDSAKPLLERFSDFYIMKSTSD